MELRSLGSQGPTISVIGYGGWEAGRALWGAAPPDVEILAAMQAGFDMGVNWVDTAEIYGKGRSEDVIGQAIKGWPEVMTFTKVASAPRGSGYDPISIRRAAEASLRRLHRDAIDLYQLHWPDETDVPLEDAWGAMADLANAGLVRWIGVSNFTSGQIERCEHIRHVDSLQPHLSMLWQERLPLLDVCSKNGIGVIAYGPLAFGLLTGAIGRETTFPDDDWRSGRHGVRAYDQLFARGRFESNLGVADALRPVAKRLRVSLSQLALAWLLHRDGITGAIVGSRSPEHVRENAAASNIRLSTEDLATIDRILQNRAELTVPLRVDRIE